MGFQIDVMEGARHLGDLRKPWLDLLPAARWAAFAHPDWCSSIWESYAPTGQVVFLAAHSNGGVAGLLPISLRRMNRFGLFLPIAEAFGGARGDYGCILVEDTRNADLIDALLEAAILRAKRAGVFVLPNVPEESGLHTSVQRFLGQRGYAYTRRESSCPLILLKGTVEETQRSFSKSLRTDLRRQAKRIEENLGPLSFSVIRSREEALRLLPLFFEMHDRRWLQSGRPGTFSDQASRSFFSQVTSRMWDSGLHISTLSCQDRIIAFHFGVLSAGFLLYYKPTYDVALHPFSPGKLLLARLVGHGIEEGWKGIDLLQGSEGYKDQWATREAKTFTYLVRTFPKSPSYWWLTEGRPWVQRRFGAIYNRTAVRFQSLRQKK